MSSDLIQCRLLVLLEEAGEEDVAALANTLCRSPSMDAVMAFVDVLARFVERGYIRFALDRHEDTLHWVPLPDRESKKTLVGLAEQFCWHEGAGYWKWQHEQRLQILLTDDGQRAAKAVLEEHGYDIFESAGDG